MTTSVRRLLLCVALTASLAANAEAPPAAATPSEPPSYVASSEAAARVGERYFKAYIAKHWNEVESLLATDGRFTDPTAERVFGPVILEGKVAVMANFRENYRNLELSFERLRVMHSGDFSIFEGELTWSMKLPRRTLHIERMPLITVLRVVDGSVVEHIDYADYHRFIEAERGTPASLP